MPPSSLQSRRSFILGASGFLMVGACPSGPGAQPRKPGPMGISAIPDQNPEKLNRLYPVVAERVAKEIGVPVSYKAVTDYPAVIGARAIAQRDIDAHFHSLFLANRSTHLTPFTNLSD